MLFWAIPGVCPPHDHFRFFVLLLLFIYPIDFTVMFFLFPYFTPKLFASFASSCWFILVHSPPICWSHFILLFWNVLFWLYCLSLSLYFLSLSSFIYIFWFIFSILVCCFVLVFSSQNISACSSFLRTLACCHSFFTRLSNQISRPDFLFLFEFLTGKTGLITD